jgi:hypothetical protein
MHDAFSILLPQQMLQKENLSNKWEREKETEKERKRETQTLKKT